MQCQTTWVFSVITTLYVHLVIPRQEQRESLFDCVFRFIMMQIEVVYFWVSRFIPLIILHLKLHHEYKNTHCNGDLVTRVTFFVEWTRLKGNLKPALIGKAVLWRAEFNQYQFSIH